MDTAKTITHISLCAGYGGIDLGLKRAIPSLRTVAFSEIEAFACANLVAKMEAGLLDAAPIWSNLKTFPWEAFRGKVDVLSGGYPCQPFSSAGKRLGKDDPRHLWPYIAAGIAAMQPRLCFFENVEGHISLGLRDVIEELGRLGYEATWGVFSASEVGAPHQRKRVFILAHRDNGRGGKDQLLSELRSAGVEQSPRGSRILCAAGKEGEVTIWPSRPGEPQHGWEPPRVVGNTSITRLEGGQQSSTAWTTTDPAPAAGGVGNGNGINRSASTSGREHDAKTGSTGEVVGDTYHGRLAPSLNARGSSEADQRGESDIEQAEPRQTQPSLGRDAHGSACGLDYAELCVSGDNRTDELRLLGNGVVPATATLAFTTLLKQLSHESHQENQIHFRQKRTTKQTMKIKDLPQDASLEGTRFIYPVDGQTYHWFSQWQRGVWGKKNMEEKQVYPLFVTDLKEALEWEVVDTSSMLTTHEEEGSAANFERYIA